MINYEIRINMYNDCSTVELHNALRESEPTNLCYLELREFQTYKEAVEFAEVLRIVIGAANCFVETETVEQYHAK